MINWFSGKLKDIFHLALSGYVHLSHNFTNLVFLTSSLLLSIAGLQLTSRRPQLGQVFPLSRETYLFFLQIVPFFLCLFLISTSIGALSVGWKPSLLLSPFQAFSISFCFSKRLNSLKFLDKMEQPMCKILQNTLSSSPMKIQNATYKKNQSSIQLCICR